MFPDLNYLTTLLDSTYNYRPAIGPMPGNDLKVIFERVNPNDGKIHLYQFLISDFENVTPFLQTPNAVPAGQTRPDWNWTADRIIFNAGNYGPGGVFHAYTADTDGGNVSLLAGGENGLYPTWLPAGKAFLAMNMSGTPSPCTTMFDVSSGAVIAPNVNGIWRTDIPPPGPSLLPVMADVNLCGGMPAVNHIDPSMIAFAGQPTSHEAYNQKQNYIFLSSPGSEPGSYESVPLEDGAPFAYDSRFQGRAPAWSADGQTIAFESNRNGAYAIFLCNVPTRTITQVTDDRNISAQHAKFFPDGNKLVFCAGNLGADPDWQIAWVDISDLL